MIEVGSKIHKSSTSVRSMTAWGKLKSKVDLVCPCHVEKTTDLVVLSVLSRRLILAQGIQNNETVNVVLDIADIVNIN